MWYFYQIICILPLFGKQLEAIINSKYVKHLTLQVSLSDKQYIFSFSTADVITNITEGFYKILD